MTTIDIDSRTWISQQSGGEWWLYRDLPGGPKCTGVYSTLDAAQMAVAANHDAQIQIDIARENFALNAAVNGDGVGKFQFRAPR